jgi:outer membrane lipoprotein
MNRALFLLSLMILSISCAPAIPRELREVASRELTLREVQEQPQAHAGKNVLWGGRILRTENRKEGTLLEILKLPLTGADRPRQVDRSQGRFLYLYPGYLDKAVYSEGREVTVVGRIKGVENRLLDQIEYSYPFIEGRTVHLWEERLERPRGYDYPPPYWGHPYWGGRHPLWW